MMVVPAPLAIIPSSDSRPDADRGKKTAANPIPAAKSSRPTRHRLASLNGPGMFSSYIQLFEAKPRERANGPAPIFFQLGWARPYCRWKFVRLALPGGAGGA